MLGMGDVALGVREWMLGVGRMDIGCEGDECLHGVREIDVGCGLVKVKLFPKLYLPPNPSEFRPLSGG